MTTNPSQPAGTQSPRTQSARTAPPTPRPVQQSTQDVPMNKEEREQFYKQRRSRSVGLAVALGAVVILFYAISLIQGPGILHRAM